LGSTVARIVVAAALPGAGAVAAGIVSIALKNTLWSDAMKKFLKQYKVVFEGLFGILIVQPIMWEILKSGALGRGISDDWRLGVLIALDLLTFGWFFRHSLTPDKTGLKPKWW
jgi:hypothetical protein